MATTVRLALVAAALLAAGSAQAAGVSFDATLASPGAYWGAGNSPDHFVTDTEQYSTGHSAEIGLGTITRFVGPVTPDAGTSTYHVPTGDTTVGGQVGANWGFPFSLNLNALGGPSAVLGNVTTNLSITDVLRGNTVAFDPLALLVDNGEYGLGGTSGNCQTTPGPCGSGQYGFQNSGALSFATGLPSGYDPAYDTNDNDTYIITFAVSCLTSSVCGDTGSVLASVTETVIQGTGAAVPEPGALAVLVSGLIGMGMIRRGRREGAGTVAAISL